MHWADVLAKEVAPKSDHHVLATAITPSGPIHVGNLREVLTTEFVARSLRDVEKVKADLIYIADSYDPLRKVYPFLNPAVYQEHVGRPLAEIPCPCREHKTYSEHFLAPFFEAMRELGVELKTLDAYAMYREGRYNEEIRDALGSTTVLRDILSDESGRKLTREWVPFNVQCKQCRRLNGTRALSVEGTQIEYSCVCGEHGRIDATSPGAGKLPWRIDWPARWRFLKVTFEAMGKDHAAAGGSWDTGVRIAKQVYGIEPPTRTVYEFVQLKGIGAMHSSTGTAIAAGDVLKMTPPEVLRFFIAHNQPNKHIDFDPGLGILDLVDEYDEWERVHHKANPVRTGMNDVERTYELSQPRTVPTKLPLQAGYRHLSTIVQIAPRFEEILKILERGGLLTAKPAKEDEARLRSRIEHVRYWLARFAPSDVKFEIQTTLPAAAWTEEERTVLAEIKRRLANVAWEPEAIHAAVHGAAGDVGLSPTVAFRSVYKALLGKERGPRAGFFLASLERAWVLDRLSKAALG